MKTEAQIAIVTCSDYAWLYVNDCKYHSGHEITTHHMLEAIHHYELDGSYATYTVDDDYVEHMGGDLHYLFSDIPTEELMLDSAGGKRK